MKQFYPNLKSGLELRQNDGPGDYDPPCLWATVEDRKIRFSSCPMAVPSDYMIMPSTLEEDVPDMFLDSPELSTAVHCVLTHLRKCGDWRSFCPSEVLVEKSVLDAIVARGFLLAGQYVTYQVTIGFVHDLYLWGLIARGTTVKLPPPDRGQV